MKVAGFDWDRGNWPKCGKHGLSKADIERVFTRPVRVFDDPNEAESRFRVIGRADDGRYVLVVVCLRGEGDDQLLRPISARYMHAREVEHYERQTNR